MMYLKVAFSICFIFTCQAFQRIFLKLYTEPSNTEKKDFMQVYDPENFEEIEMNKYLSCDGDLYFGPFESNTILIKDYQDLVINPHKSISGEFQLLILDQLNSSPLYTDQFQITFYDQKVNHFTEIKKLKPLPCSSMKGVHSLYQI